jgi:hypothetical protein
MNHSTQTYVVIPAQAGTQGGDVQTGPLWIPAFAGMTGKEAGNV